MNSTGTVAQLTILRLYSTYAYPFNVWKFFVSALKSTVVWYANVLENSISFDTESILRWLSVRGIHVEVDPYWQSW